MSRRRKFFNLFSKTGRTINKLAKDVEENLEDIEKYDATRKQIADRLAILDSDGINLQSGDIRLDIRNTIKKHERKGVSKAETLKKLTTIVNKAKKSAAIARSVGGSNMRVNIAVNELMALRDSEKYKAMANSAAKGSFVANEEDFWIRTVRVGAKTLGVNKDELISALNTKLREAGYSEVSKSLVLKG